MTAPSTDYRFCHALGRAVRTGHSEGRCRDDNDCAVVDCPLSAVFGDIPQARMARNLAAATGVTWFRETAGL